jgi:lysophospholipid acyltransferase 1/2
MLETTVHYLTEVFGVPHDQCRCVLLLFMGFPLALVFRHVLHPSGTPLPVRHLFSALSGLTLATLCFGWHVLYLVTTVGVSYIILLTTSPKTVQRWTMGWILPCMCLGHLHRTLTDFGGWRLDVTGPMMVLFQKLSLVAFATHDGTGGNSKPLNDDQEKQKLTSVPTVLEYMSYCFNFHSVLAGPAVTMREHLSFMDGSNFHPPPPPPPLPPSSSSSSSHDTTTSRKPAREPSAFNPVVTKLLTSVFFGLVYVSLLEHSVPLPIGPSWNIVQQLAYFYLVTFVVRCRFYFIFSLNDSLSNAAGLGFEGYDSENRPRWGLATNINVLDMELSMNMRNSINSWNITSARWLRRSP